MSFESLAPNQKYEYVTQQKMERDWPNLKFQGYGWYLYTSALHVGFYLLITSSQKGFLVEWWCNDYHLPSIRDRMAELLDLPVY